MRTLLLFITCIFSLSVMAVEKPKVFDSQYHQWNQLTNEELMEKGKSFQLFEQQPDSALLCFSIMANRLYEKKQSRHDRELSIEAMSRTGQLYAKSFNDFVKAESYFLQAEELAEKHQYDFFLPIIHLNLASLKALERTMVGGDKFFQETVDEHREVFYEAMKMKNWHALSATFINMMLRTTMFDKESLIQDEMDIIRQLHVPDSTGELTYAKSFVEGVEAYNNGRKDEALLWFKKMLNDADHMSDPEHVIQGKVFAHHYLCFWYGANGDDDTAFQQIIASEELARKNNYPVYLMDAYKKLHLFFKEKNQPDSATKYYIKLLEQKDLLLSQNKLAGVSDTGFLYELNKKNEEVKALARERGLHRTIISLTCALIAALTITLLLLFRRYRQTELHNRQLYLKTLELLKADKEKRELIEEQAPKKYEHSSLDETAKSELLHRIFMVMETSEDIYNEGFTINQLADLVGDKRNNVSQAINEKYHMDFTALLREYRIKEACRRMNDQEHYGNYTIEAIAQSVGFKSRSNFGAAFRSVTGLTPSVYQRMAKKH